MSGFLLYKYWISAYNDLFRASEDSMVVCKLLSTIVKPSKTLLDTFSANIAVNTKYIIFIIFCLGVSGQFFAPLIEIIFIIFQTVKFLYNYLKAFYFDWSFLTSDRST